jgi:hypothetical protein
MDGLRFLGVNTNREKRTVEVVKGFFLSDATGMLEILPGSAGFDEDCIGGCGMVTYQKRYVVAVKEIKGDTVYFLLHGRRHSTSLKYGGVRLLTGSYHAE